MIAENETPENENRIIPSEPSRTTTTTLLYDYENKEEVITENLKNANSSDPNENPLNTDPNPKKVPLIIFHKFNPQELLRPVQQKWKEVQDLLMYPFHPNYGGVIVFSPQHIWSKLKEKGNFLLGGAHNSIYGVAHTSPEYPFPYRRNRLNL